MLSSERRQAISQLVAQRSAVNVTELADQFEVSGSTIRRDLEHLERQGLIRRVHGGATLPDVSRSAPLAAAGRGGERIGRAAANRVRADETVYLGPGRLTLETAKALTGRVGVAVITNSLEIAHWLVVHSTLTVVVTGGTAGGPFGGLSGPLVSSALRSLRADRVIIEAVGISPDQGLLAGDPAQAEIFRELMVAAGESIALVPPERIGRVGGVLVGPANDLDVVVTGREAPEALLWDLSQMGIAIISV